MWDILAFQSNGDIDLLRPYIFRPNNGGFNNFSVNSLTHIVLISQTLLCSPWNCLSWGCGWSVVDRDIKPFLGNLATPIFISCLLLGNSGLTHPKLNAGPFWSRWGKKINILSSIWFDFFYKYVKSKSWYSQNRTFIWVNYQNPSVQVETIALKASY